MISVYLLLDCDKVWKDILLSRTIQLSLFIFTTLTLACVPRLCTHFYFSLPTEKFLRGQGEKNTRAEKGI